MSKTALNYSPQELRAFRRPGDALRHRRARRGEEEAERRKRAWQVARQAAQILYETYKAERVVLFGSLANDTWFTLWSDVDLAAWGIPDDQFFAAVAAVIDLSPEFDVDLLDPDACQPSLREVIEQEGVLL